tara:strand:- start:2603 stop:3796 length:1194 start_codon:yes stop_codon:yes gene_type:complete
MNIAPKIITLLLFFTLCCISCVEKTTDNSLENQISEIKTRFAPDKRVALFSVAAVKKEDHYVLKGESNLPEAIAALKERLNLDHIDFTDSILLLPAEELHGYTMGLVTISVANLRSKPAHSAELATQALLGTPIKVYKKEGNWSLVQTPDKYLSWVDGGGITPLDSIEMSRWKSASKIIYTQTTGYAYSEADHRSQIVSDMVAGAVLVKLLEQGDYIKVLFPDGRIAFLAKSEAQDYDRWLNQLQPSVNALVETSKTLMGLPYLWGGTSPKGVDCSGFTKTIFFLNGMVIPRDASQQVLTGIPIDSIKNFKNIEKGDLLFFGRKATDSTAEKVVHVGMWIGNNEFIHASGRVRVGSMDPTSENYDAYNLNRYLRTKRLFREEGNDLFNLLNTPIFKD